MGRLLLFHGLKVNLLRFKPVFRAAVAGCAFSALSLVTVSGHAVPIPRRPYSWSKPMVERTSSNRFSTLSESGVVCRFDPASRTLSFTGKNGVIRSPPLDIPSIAEYVAIAHCGREYAVLLTNDDIVLIRGTTALSTGDFSLPGRNGATGVTIDIRNALALYHYPSVSAVPVAWNVSENTGNVFILGSNGVLIHKNILQSDNMLLRVNMSDFFRFPVSVFHPVMRAHSGKLFVFQPDSDRVAVVSMPFMDSSGKYSFIFDYYNIGFPFTTASKISTTSEGFLMVELGAGKVIIKDE